MAGKEDRLAVLRLCNPRLRMCRAVSSILFLGGTFFLLFVLGYLVARSCQAGRAPRVYIGAPLYDFGLLEPGVRAVHHFRIMNRGRRQLQLKRIRTSCGCLVASCSQQVIGRWGYAEIAVALDSVSELGSRGAVWIETNDPATPVVALEVRARLSSDVVYSPPRIDFGDIRAGEVVGRRVLVIDRGGRGLQGVKVLSRPGECSAEIVPGRTPDGTQFFEVRVRVGPLLTPVHVIQGSLRLAFDMKDGYAVTVPIEGRIVGDLVVTPPCVVMVGGEVVGPADRRLVVTSRSGVQPTIQRIEVEPAIMEVHESTSQRGSEVGLVLRGANYEAGSIVKGTITLTAGGSAGTERLTVPFCWLGDGSGK